MEKKPNVFLKLLTTVGFAALFGFVAAVVYFGVRIAGEKLLMPRIIENGSEITSEEGEDTPVTSEDPLQGLEPLGEVTTEATEQLEADNEAIAESDTDMTVIDVVKKAMPSVVSINVTVDTTMYGKHIETEGAGSGIIVEETEEKLLVATNYHVVENEISTTVQFCDGTSAPAEVKGKKVSMDLAVLTINKADIKPETIAAIKVAALGDSNELVVGQSAIAIGNALGYGQAVTTGVVSAVDRAIGITEDEEAATFIQTDAAINPGNSGGALLNLKGEVIGINSNKIGGGTVEGMGYAIPISDARPIIEKLIDKKDLVELPADQQSYFGISGTAVKSGLKTSDGKSVPQGIYVAGVVQGSSADTAGIMKGDIITEFEGDSIVSMDELKQYLASYSSGSTVKITYERYENGKYVEYVADVFLQAKEVVPTEIIE